MLRQDWKGYHAIRVSLVYRRCQSTSLTTEHEHDIGRNAQLSIPQHARAFGRQKEGLAEVWQLTLELLPAFPQANIDVLPVVETGPTQLTIVEREAEWLHEM